MYPPFYCDYVKCLRLPESTPPSQNIPPFSTTICDPPRIYSFLPEYTPFQQLILCDPPRIYPSLPEYTSPLSTTTCDPPRTYYSLPEYIPFFNKFICGTLLESTPPSQNISLFSTNLYVRPSQNLPLSPKIYPLFNNYMWPSQDLPPPPPRIFFSSGSEW